MATAADGDQRGDGSPGGVSSGVPGGALWSRWKAAPRPLAAVVALVAMEGLGLFVLAGFLGLETVVSTTASLGGAVAFAIFVLASGAGLVYCALGLLRRERWSRAPTAVAQLCSLPVAVTMLGAGQRAAGVTLLVLTSATLVLLFAPTVVRETTE